MNILIGVISDAAVWVLPREYVERLRREFPQHTFLEAWDHETVRRLLPEADAAFTPYVDRDVFPRARRLRWVQAVAVGVGSMLYAEMVASPVVITNARGIRARAMAEHVIGVSLALARRLHVAVRRQMEHAWAQTELEGSGAIHLLAERRLGVVGLGAIGTETARLAAAFGMRVSAIRRRVELPLPEGVEEVLPPERLHDLLGKSDVVVLSPPLTSATRGLIGRRELAAMKPDAFLVNIGRGRLVDDEALVEALRAQRIGGAALDVFVHEPLDPSSPYWDLPNVIVTPHTSGAMEDYWTPLVALFAENLRRLEAGRPLLNVVDKHAGY
ncbi:MAG: D-2-hydroxyacid dehydrogenase [Betaproteobacteria bacterium]